VVSGIKFKFDPSRAQGSRIILDSIRDDDDQVIDLDKRFTVAVGSNLLLGKDGYEIF
jgi:hypothetical protein